MSRSASHMESLTVLLLCGLFLFFAAGAALVGSGVYRHTARQARQTSALRTASAYLSQQARQCRETGGFADVGALEGQPALLLRDGEYVTYLYCHEGYLRELLTEWGTQLPPSAGTALYPLDSLALQRLDDNLLEASLQGPDVSARVRLRCANTPGEVGP